MRWSTDQCYELTPKQRALCRKKRWQLGLTVTALADALDMSRDTYYRALRGDTIGPQTRDAIVAWVAKEN